MHRADDLAAVDALEVDARDAQVGVSELALDHNEWDALVRHLHGVRVPELMRRESTPDTGVAAQDARAGRGGRGPRVPRRNQTGAYCYLAYFGGGPVGYVDCGTFNRCTVYAGDGAEGPIVTESIEDATGSIAFVIAPQIRRRGVGRAMISALIHQPELGFVELFEAGVEPANVASRRCLEAVGFGLGSEKPDFEGMLYYRAWRPDLNPGATLSA